MNLNKLTKNHFAIFAFIWSAATISHQFFYGLIFSSNLDLTLTILALLTFIRPSIYQFFLAQVFIQTTTIFIYLPNVYNHWFLAFIASLTIVLNYLKIIISQKSFHTCAKELYKNFGPVLRIIIIIVYVSASFHKLNTDFLSIDVGCSVYMYSKILKIYVFMPDGELIRHISVYLSLAIEITIPLLLLFRKTRMLGILIGLYIHLIFGFIGYRNFSFIMVALLALYLPADFFNSGKNLNTNKQNNIKAIFYIFTLLLTVIFISGRITYILNDQDMLNNFGIIVHAILSIGLICIFIHFLNFRKYEWPKNFFKINYLNSIIILIVILNSFSPYLGLKTQNVFSMYSNLRTENNSSNHLLMKDSNIFGNYQSDLVKIEESNIDQIKNNMILPYSQLQNYLFEAYRSDKRDIRLKYIKNNKVVDFDGADDTFALKNSTLNYLKWKFFNFKPVSINEKQSCGL